MDEIIAIGGLSITFITALVTFLTVNEMKKQRQNMYLPDLFIGDGFVDVYAYGTNETYEGFMFSHMNNSEKKNKYIENPDERSPWIRASIINIGFGAAKYVEYKWAFDFEKCYTMLTSVNNGDFRIEYDANEFNDIDLQMLSIKKNDHYGIISVKDALQETETDFVSPSSSTETIYEISIPTSYTNFVMYYLLMKYNMFSGAGETFIHDELNEFPLLYLNINYKDLGNKVHVKNHSLKISASRGGSNYKDKPYFMPNERLGWLQIKAKEVL